MGDIEKKKWIIVVDDYDPIRDGSDDELEILEKIYRMQLDGAPPRLYERKEIEIPESFKETIKKKMWTEAIDYLPRRAKILRDGIAGLERSIKNGERNLVKIANGTYYALNRPSHPLGLDFPQRTAQDYKEETENEITKNREGIVRTKKELAVIESILKLMEEDTDVLEWDGKDWIIKKELREAIV